MESLTIITWLITYLISSLILAILSLATYYGFFIYKSFELIKSAEYNTESKIIYIKDINTRLIDRILLSIYSDNIISINDNNSLRRILQNNENKKIILLIQSTGGYISSSDSMLNLLDVHKQTKIAYVPTYAMSAATLLTLACDNIHINKYAVIGPTEPQISVFNEMISFYTLCKLIENKPITKIGDEILISYYENKVLYDENINYINKYINKHKKENVSKEELDELIKKFSCGNIPHHSQISYESLNKLININNKIPEDILIIYKILNYILNII
jgi:membrane-bound ClpP family serine protease